MTKIDIKIISIILLVLIFLFGPKRYAIPAANHVDICLDSQTDPAERILSCTTLIDGEKAAETDLYQYLKARAKAYRQSKNFEMAIADIDKAIDLKPQVSQNWVFRGVINAERGSDDMASADFSKSLQVDIGNFGGDIGNADTVRMRALAYRAVSFEIFGEYDLALKDYEAVWGNGAAVGIDWIVVDGGVTRLVDRMVKIALIQKKYDFALSILDEVPKVYANSSQHFEYLGYLHLLYTLEAKKAIKAFETAYKLAPEKHIHLGFLGIAYLRNQEEEKGKKLVQDYAKHDYAKEIYIDGFLYTSGMSEINAIRLVKSHSFGLSGRIDLALAEVDKVLESGDKIARDYIKSQLIKNITANPNDDELRRLWSTRMKRAKDMMSLEWLSNFAKKNLYETISINPN